MRNVLGGISMVEWMNENKYKTISSECRGGVGV